MSNTTIITFYNVMLKNNDNTIDFLPSAFAISHIKLQQQTKQTNVFAKSAAILFVNTCLLESTATAMYILLLKMVLYNELQ